MKTVVYACLLIVFLVSPGFGQMPDRSQPPPVGDPRPFSLPKLEAFELSNGLAVLLLERHQVPIAQISLVVEAGRSRESAGEYGLASLTADMLDEGAGGRSALELAEEFTFLGATFRVATDAYTTTVSVRAPLGRMESALELVSDVVLRPTFQPDELERLRVDRLTTLLSQHDEPNIIARVMFAKTLYGEAHPYGRSNAGDEGFLRRVAVDDLRPFHEAFYRANNAAVIVVGDVTRESIEPLLESAFAKWTAVEIPAASIAMVSQVKGRKIYLVDKPGAAQSVIRIGRLGATRDTEDYYALEVMNTVLGGSFASRLVQNLREDKGYTYGAWSYFEYGRNIGPFIAAAAVQTSVTGPSLAEFMKELNGIMDPVPSGELERARNYLAMSFPQDFSSVASIASKVEDLRRYRLPEDHYDYFVNAVLSIEQDEVRRVAQEYLDPDNMIIVVVGDRKEIEQQVLDGNIGDIEFLTVTDVLGEPPDLSNN